MASFLDYFSHSFNTAKLLAKDTEVQKWLLFYVFFMATFSTLFSMFNYVTARSFPVVVVFCTILYALYFAGMIYFSVKLLAASFAVLGLKTRKYGYGVATFVSGISQFIVSMLLLMDRKLFLLFAFFLLLFVGSAAYVYFAVGNAFLAVIFLMLLALAAIPYVFFFIYHSNRLFFTQLFFLSGKTFSESVSESWMMVGGRSLRTFVTLAVGAFITALVAFPFTLLNILFSSIVKFAAKNFSANVSPVMNLFASALSFPFDFLLYMVSGAFILYYIGLFHFLLQDSGRLSEYSARKPALVGKKKAK
ncbi:MAG: hypothetical protein WC408_03510 [Candidatus Micrarchaeia archaeon]|jgi:hypothetical protein